MTFSIYDIEVNNNLALNGGSFSYLINGSTLSSNVDITLSTTYSTDEFVLSNYSQTLHNKILLSSDNTIDASLIKGITVSSNIPNIGEILSYNGSYWTPCTLSVSTTTVITTATSSIIDVSTPNTYYSVTSLSSAIIFTTSGTYSNFDKMVVRVKDNGVAQALTFDPTNFEPKGQALPTTTVISKVLTVGFIYDSVTTKFGCVSVAQEI